MKKVIRLDENDIEKLVKKIIKEDENTKQLNITFPEDEDSELSEDDDLRLDGYNMGHILTEELNQLISENEEHTQEILDGFIQGSNENGLFLQIDSYQGINYEYNEPMIGGESNSVNEAWPKRELDRKATNFRRGDFKPYKREKNVENLFGKYSEDIPPAVIQYLRKNPAQLIKRLVKTYGIDRVYEYVDMAQGVQESYNLNDIISEKKEEKFIQKAEKRMEKKGTVGSFKEYCGGEVTMSCINKALKSDDPSIVKKANYAKNIGGYKGAKH